MNIYDEYTDKAIRNKIDQGDVEMALTNSQASEAADKIVQKYKNEPQFLLEVTDKLIQKIKSQAPKRHNTEE